MTKEMREELLKHQADDNCRRRWINVSGAKINSVIIQKDGTAKPLAKNILDTVDVKPDMLVVALEPDNTIGCGKRIFRVESEPYLKRFNGAGDKLLITFDVKETHNFLV